MKFISFLLLASLTIAECCRTDFDCAQCHTCKANICVPVADHTDPNDECPFRCGVKTVCGPMHICVFQQRPSCKCDWLEGNCVEESTDINEAPSVEEMQKQGLSDLEIKEILYYLHTERRNEHKDHYHILPEDHAEAHDFMMLTIIILLSLVMSVILCAISSIKHQKSKKEIKSR
jgi:hypothetical protein